MSTPASPAEWLPDGTPQEPPRAPPLATRSDDRDRSGGDHGHGGIRLARQVFLDGCNLPAAWRGAPAWTVLATGFGLGLNFLATWQAWRADADAPRVLHYVATEACLPAADELRRSAAPDPELAPLVADLADRWSGLLPGFHRLALDGGRVQLTLGIGDAPDR